MVSHGGMGHANGVKQLSGKCLHQRFSRKGCQLQSKEMSEDSQTKSGRRNGSSTDLAVVVQFKIMTLEVYC